MQKAKNILTMVGHALRDAWLVARNAVTMAAVRSWNFVVKNVKNLFNFKRLRFLTPLFYLTAVVAVAATIVSAYVAYPFLVTLAVYSLLICCFSALTIVVRDLVIMPVWDAAIKLHQDRKDARELPQRSGRHHIVEVATA